MNFQKNLLLIFSLLFSSTAIAQDDALINKVTEETCECVSQKDLSKMSSSELEMELGMCMMISLSKDGNLENFDVTDDKAMEKFGEKVGMKMVGYCPEILMKIGMVTEMIEGEETAREITGTFKDLEEGDFSYILIEDEVGREHKLLWMQYFPGSEDLLVSAKKKKGKKVTIQYETIECYSAKIGDYINKKVVSGIAF